MTNSIYTNNIAVGTQSLKSFNISKELDLEKARRFSFEVTSKFEGGKVDSLQTKDSGIISYGKHQATLKSGALHKLLEDFVKSSNSGTANEMKKYLLSTERADKNLRNNQEFLNLLKSAAKLPEMEVAQDRVFIKNYWEPTVQLAEKIGVSSKEGLAILYDTKVQGGLETILNRTQRKLKKNALNERQFFSRFLDERKNYIMEVSKTKRQSGDTESANMLKNSAVSRISELKKLLER